MLIILYFFHIGNKSYRYFNCGRIQFRLISMLHLVVRLDSKIETEVVRRLPVMLLINSSAPPCFFSSIFISDILSSTNVWNLLSLIYSLEIVAALIQVRFTALLRITREVLSSCFPVLLATDFLYRIFY